MSARPSSALPPEDVGPFRGLAVYDLADRAVYFGRSAEVAAALEVLGDRGVLALVGASGAGKSSLARAGVLPAIADGALGASPPSWDVVVCAPGNDPRARIGRALAGFVDGAARSTPAELASRLAERAAHEGRGLALLIDPLDDAIVLAGDDASRAFLGELLARLGDEPRPGVRAIVTVRRDLFDGALALGGAPLARGALLVDAMDDCAWGDVLDRALAAYGYAFEDDALRSELLASIRQHRAAMPVVAFALARLWEKRDTSKKRVSRASVRAIGGVDRALALHLEAALARVEALGPGARALAQRVLLALTMPAGTRRAQATSELEKLGDPALAKKVVRDLETAGLLVAAEQTDDATLTLAHEAFVTAWPTLAGWAADARRDRALADEIERDAARWVSERGASVWPPGRLAAAEALRQRGAASLSKEARAFLDAGRRDDERRRKRSRLGTLAFGALACASVATAFYAHGRERVAELAARDAREDRAALERRQRANDVAYRAWNVDDAQARIALYQAALKEDDHWDHGYFLLAGAYLDRAEELDATDPNEAAATRQKAIDAAKASVAYGVGARGYFQLARALAESGDAAGARDEYMEAARTAGAADAFVAHAALAAVAEGEHRWPDVIDEATKALAATAGDDVTLSRRALAELRTGATDAALADVTAAIAVAPKRARDYALRSDVRLARGDAKGAAEDLATGALANGRAPRVLARLARWALDHGAFDRAANLAAAAVDAGDRVPDTFLARARVARAEGDEDRAKGDVEAALSLDPLDEDAARMKAGDGVKLAGPELLLAQGKAAEALAAIDEAKKKGGETLAPALLTLRATARRRLGMADDGDAEKAVAAGDASPRALRERAFARMAKGHAEEAASDATRALAGDALDPEARILAVRLGLAVPDARRDDAEVTRDLALLAIIAPDLTKDVEALRAEIASRKGAAK